MTSSPDKRLDMPLIAAVLDRQISRTPGLGNPERLARTSGISRATIYRILKHDDRVKIRTLQQLEPHLGLPFDSLAAIGHHDFDVLAELGVEADLIGWIRNKSVKSRETGTDSAVAT